MKEVVKRARNVREVFFDFNRPSMEIIEMLPECLEHLPYLWLRDSETFSGKFRRLKSLMLTNFGFDHLQLKILGSSALYASNGTLCVHRYFMRPMAYYASNQTFMRPMD